MLFEGITLLGVSLMQEVLVPSGRHLMCSGVNELNYEIWTLCPAVCTHEWNCGIHISTFGYVHDCTCSNVKSKARKARGDVK